MKLTIIQITILREATREAVHAYAAKAAAAKEAQPALESYWLNEAAEARQLLHILNDALCIEVESASLEPATPAANPAHKEALEKQHAELTAALQHVKQQQAELLKPLRDRYTEMAKRIMNEEEERIAQTHPEEEEAPHATTDPTADKSADLWGGPRSQPRREKRADTSHAATPAEAMPPSTPVLPGHPESSASAALPACTGAQAPHDAASSLNAPTSTHAGHSHPAGNPSACGEAMNSSAHTGEACGDINCDGQCHLAPAAKPDHPPALIQLIDVSPTVDAARITTAKASAAALRAAARFLRTDMHSLPAVITRRVHERLAKTAA